MPNLGYNQRILLWGLPNFLELQQLMFYCILLTNFRRFGTFGVLCPAIFSNTSPEFPKNFWILHFHYFVQKLVQNHYIDHKLAKSSLKTPKTVYFFSETSIFHNFLCFWCQKFRVYVPNIPDLLELAPNPQARVSPPNYTLVIALHEHDNAVGASIREGGIRTTSIPTTKASISRLSICILNSKHFKTLTNTRFFWWPNRWAIEMCRW